MQSLDNQTYDANTEALENEVFSSSPSLNDPNQHQNLPTRTLTDDLDLPFVINRGEVAQLRRNQTSTPPPLAAPPPPLGAPPPPLGTPPPGRRPPLILCPIDDHVCPFTPVSSLPSSPLPPEPPPSPRPKRDIERKNYQNLNESRAKMLGNNGKFYNMY